MEEGSRLIVSHYDVLGAPADAEYAELRSKYRAAILALHPDKLSSAGGQSLEALNRASNDCLGVLSSEDNIIPPSKLNSTIKDLDGEDHQFSWSTMSNAGTGEGDGLLSRFLSVQNAWEVLRDSESRAKYDDILRTERSAYEMKSTRIIGDEIHLREMDCCRTDLVNGQEVEYSYPCRCGDLIVVSQEELQFAGFEFCEEASQEARRGISARSESQWPKSNSLVLPCQSCSMHVRVLYS